MTRGRHPAKTNEQTPVATLDPTAPLTGAAMDKFRAVVTLLSTQGKLFPIAADALTRYAQLWARNQRAAALIEADGPTVATATGVKRHPACSEADSTEKAMMAISRELGLTSLAAGRLGGGPKSAETEQLDEFDAPS